MPTDSSQPDIQPLPGSNSSEPEAVESEESATNLQAPYLFNPSDRSAGRSVAPVRTAVYEQPVGYQRAALRRGPVTAEQAQQDAIGWTSAGN
jgi:hypothetical protein